MYYRACQQIAKTLHNLSAILDKAERHAAAKNVDSSKYLSLRFAPDMYPMARQVQQACDIAINAAAQFSGREVPGYAEHTERTISELKLRIDATLKFVGSVKEEDAQRMNEESAIPLTWPRGKTMLAPDLLFSRSLPNFFFHVTTAYNLLRRQGVPLGKSDYLGELVMADA